MLSEKVDKNGSTFDTRRGLPLTRKKNTISSFACDIHHIRTMTQFEKP